MNKLDVFNNIPNGYEETKWEKLQVGDELIDGSIVEVITPWELKTCYILDVLGQEIVASEDHLFCCKIYVDDICMNKDLTKSAEIRKEIGIIDPKPVSYKGVETNIDFTPEWICTSDIAKFARFPNKNIQMEMYLNNGETIVAQLLSIKLYKNGEKQRVRCIKTNTGKVITSGFVSHNTGGKNLEEAKRRDVIMHTLKGWKNSAIIQDVVKKETTQERREAMFQGLKKAYNDNGVTIDDWNLKVLAKKMTSYKRDSETKKLRFIKDDEVCDIVSIGAIGSASNPFKSAELSSPYRTLTVPQKFKAEKDSAMDLIFK